MKRWGASLMYHKVALIVFFAFVVAGVLEFCAAWVENVGHENSVLDLCKGSFELVLHTSVRVIVACLAEGVGVLRSHFSSLLRLNFVVMNATLYGSLALVQVMVGGGVEWVEIAGELGRLVSDVVFYLMVYYFLTVLLNRLEREEGGRRLYEVYCRFSVVMFLAAVFALLGLLGKIIGEMEGKVEEYWRVWWLWDAYWEVFYCVVVIAVAWVWKPCGRDGRYFMIGEEEGEELAEMNGRNPNIVYREVMYDE